MNKQFMLPITVTAILTVIYAGTLCYFTDLSGLLFGSFSFPFFFVVVARIEMAIKKAKSGNAESDKSFRGYVRSSIVFLPTFFCAVLCRSQALSSETMLVLSIIAGLGIMGSLLTPIICNEIDDLKNIKCKTD